MNARPDTPNDNGSKKGYMERNIKRQGNKNNSFRLKKREKRMIILQEHVCSSREKPIRDRYIKPADGFYVPYIFHCILCQWHGTCTQHH